MLESGHKRGVSNSVRQLDGEYLMIESPVRRRFWHNRSSLGVDGHLIGVNSDLLQHRGHQGGFVFAITITVAENVGSRVRLPSPDSQFDCHITNIILHKGRQGFHFLQWSRRVCRERRNFLLYVRRRVTPPTLQVPVPRTHVVPVAEYLVSYAAAREERYDHLSSESLH